MIAQRDLTSAEMGAATIVMIARLQDSPTEKQAMHHWNRIAVLLKTTLAILGRPVARDSKLNSLQKHWKMDGSFSYVTTWRDGNGI